MCNIQGKVCTGIECHFTINLNLVHGVLPKHITHVNIFTMTSEAYTTVSTMANGPPP